MRNLISMNEILRDRDRASIRLVMNPDRMVIKEAQRTFTYLNLYGYLTDAVIVNRVFPEAVAGGYFGAWREQQTERLAEVYDGFAPVPVLTAPYLAEEVVGPRMLDALSGELFGGQDPAAVMHQGLAREITSDNGHTTLRVAVPFAERDEISLRKVDQELVVSAGRERRTIILPPPSPASAPPGPASRTVRCWWPSRRPRRAPDGDRPSRPGGAGPTRGLDAPSRGGARRRRRLRRAARAPGRRRDAVRRLVSRSAGPPTSSGPPRPPSCATNGTASSARRCSRSGP